jgi:hypothetical protein
MRDDPLKSQVVAGIDTARCSSIVNWRETAAAAAAAAAAAVAEAAAVGSADYVL